jgi:dTDP-4-dehydrorhamnose 3,5-epimerase
MPRLKESTTIAGVYQVELKSFADARGQFVEIFRKEWFPQNSWQVIQSNRSESAAGVLRGLHFHRRQVDYWFLTKGVIRAGLADLRRSSRTRGAAEVVEFSADQELGLFIPVGVAHGFLAVTDATLIYFVNNYYDGADEFGVAWDDADIGLSWGAGRPILSMRDRDNPKLRDIPADDLPS